ncbi:MAG: enoyl-CoA hydratase-related protein, partial [Acidimicrobiales bacterium]
MITDTGAVVSPPEMKPKPVPDFSALPPVPEWEQVKAYGDIRFETAAAFGGERSPRMAKITIDRPEVRNAFRPQTLFELQDAFRLAQDDTEVGVIILTGQGDL